jgi:hypothetical protein
MAPSPVYLGQQASLSSTLGLTDWRGNWQIALYAANWQWRWPGPGAWVAAMLHIPMTLLRAYERV